MFTLRTSNHPEEETGTYDMFALTSNS